MGNKKSRMRKGLIAVCLALSIGAFAIMDMVERSVDPSFANGIHSIESVICQGHVSYSQLTTSWECIRGLVDSMAKTKKGKQELQLMQTVFSRTAADVKVSTAGTGKVPDCQSLFSGGACCS